MKPVLLVATILFCGLFIPGCQPAISSNNYSSNSEKTSSSKSPTESRNDVHVSESTGKRVRIATFNVALNRNNPGELITELEKGDSDKIRWVAEVIQHICPDILLLNEIDYDEQGKALEHFSKNYLQVAQGSQDPIDYEFSFLAPVNTGVDSGLDLNNNGTAGEPDDAFGFGKFPGQYGMAILSNYKIEKDSIRTFQKLLWKDLPKPLLPVNADGSSYYSDTILEKFRISSKSHWIVPVNVGGRTINVVCAHPTPPVFDQEEDRNGCRNHDEVRLLTDIVSGEDYLIDDRGGKGRLTSDSFFVVMGDLNSDPVDGESTNDAIQRLLAHERINSTMTPKSEGAVEAARKSGGANAEHKGDPSHDTGDFNDQLPGNLRADYVLPSRNLKLIDCGVFWPKETEPLGYLNAASDHHLVWIDVEFQSK